MPIDIASGNVHLEYEDVVIPGKFELAWERRYSAALLTRPPTTLGHGWMSSFDSTLTRSSDGFEFLTTSGGVEFFSDPEGQVDRGRLVRNFGAFQEIFLEESKYVIRCWDVDSGDVWEYRFIPSESNDLWHLSSVDDLTGQGLDLVRDRQGRLTKVVQRLERRSLNLLYYANGLLETIFVEGDRGQRHDMVRYEYDAVGRLVAATDARELSTRYQYDHKGRLFRELAKDGGVFSYQYDDRGRCVSYSGLDGYDRKRLRFIDAARVTEITDSHDVTSRYQCLPGGQISSESNGLGAVTRVEYDQHQRIVARIAANGAVTSYQYDEHGNCCQIVNAMGNVYDLLFNDRHQPLSLTDPAGHAWSRQYDAEHRLVLTTDPLGRKWNLAYDDHGNLATLTNPHGATRHFNYQHGILVDATDWSGNLTKFTFNELGRMTARTNPLGNKFEYRYDGIGNVVQVFMPGGATIRSEYDAGGLLVRSIDAQGRETRRRYGPCGRLLESVDPNGLRLQYVWDSEPDRLERAINERGEIYELSYDSAGRCLEEVGFDGRRLQFAYDLAGACIKTVNGAGQAVDIERDPLGRITRLNLPDGSYSAFVYDSRGDVVQGSNGESFVNIERDVLGRVVRETQVTGGQEHWVNYELNSLDDVVCVQTDLGFRVDYELSQGGQWTALRTSDGHIMQFQYDADGQETSRWLPGGLILNQTHDPLGALVEQRVRRGDGQRSSYGSSNWRSPSEEIVRRTYVRDNSGLVTSIYDNVRGNTRYDYDPGERLVKVACDGKSLEQLDYDETGNLTRSYFKNDRITTDDLLDYSSGNQLAAKGSTRYEHDAQGRLVRKIEDAESAQPKIWTFDWDALDQLRTISRPDGQVWRYTYDPFARRMVKYGPQGEVRFTWNGHVPIHETQSGQSETTTYLFAQYSFAPIAQIHRTICYSTVTDHLGTASELLNESGQVVWRNLQRAFGSGQHAPTQEVQCPFRFQGQYYDSESGLHYNRYRYYDPTTARFIQQDPLRLGASGNFYAYARNPIRWVDPLGLCLSSFLKNKLKRIKNETAAGGNRGISGSVTPAEARKLGEAFVGPGFRETSTPTGTPILISSDGLRQFRGPAEKSGINPVTAEPFSKTGTQVNFQSRPEPAGPFPSNVHLDVDT
jgi:RHS repeat-associated protein